jgi:hypothetical protein
VFVDEGVRLRAPHAEVGQVCDRDRDEFAILSDGSVGGDLLPRRDGHPVLCAVEFEGGAMRSQLPSD